MLTDQGEKESRDLPAVPFFTRKPEAVSAAKLGNLRVFATDTRLAEAVDRLKRMVRDRASHLAKVGSYV